MTLAASVVLVLVAGMTSQLLAARLRVPAIVILIAVGLLLGPFTGLVTVDIPEDDLSELIGIGVAVILFEGGMSLRFSEFRRVRRGIGRLTVLGPPVAMAFTAAAAHWVGGFDWPVSLVLGAILVVTGPTVIAPLLRQAGLRRDSASLLKWEGIVNDPIGVTLAFLTFQLFALSDDGVGSVARGLVFAVVVGGGMGVAVGALVGIAFRRGWVQSHLKSPLLLVAVLLVAGVGNRLQDETGLLAVTAMGLVLGNMRLPEREQLLHFKEGLTIVLVSSLFIVIPATLDAGDLAELDWRIGAFVLVLMVVVRPLTIALVTLRSDVPKPDRLLLGWIAPRGIVAAATAGSFGPAMVDAGYPDGAQLVPTVFLVILVTVVAHGFTLAPLARRLGLTTGARNGLLLVGASRFGLELAEALRRQGVGVLVADGRYQSLQPMRMAGVPTYFGEVLSEHADEVLEEAGVSHVLAATDNDYYNALVARSLGTEYGFHRSFQIPPAEGTGERRALTFERRASYAFDGFTDLATLDERVADGWHVHATHLTRQYGLRELVDRVGGGSGAIPLGAIDSAGGLRLLSPDQRFIPAKGSTILYLGPGKRSATGAIPAVDDATRQDSS
ncbi:sodium:proton antiporter [Demequina sp. SYSU T00192]|uniref:Sodium:proton antiporter n=1 Tax=Demequina litoralis TaxID=3051660 RepID=A0ABT8G7R8_9MICO|nr:sodium:proton antiporter [Demequina sp. SYSU T00192]MDN4475198.1 sodium:proton antiporter [Demequina sp. SYSU T00192]